jgi:hypothetical protein
MQVGVQIKGLVCKSKNLGFRLCRREPTIDLKMECREFCSLRSNDFGGNIWG